MEKIVFLFLKAMKEMRLFNKEDEETDLKYWYNYLKQRDFDFDSLEIGDIFEDGNENFILDIDLTDYYDIGMPIGTTKELLIDAISFAVTDATDLMALLEMVQTIASVSFVGFIRKEKLQYDLYQLLCRIPYSKVVEIAESFLNDK